MASGGIASQPYIEDPLSEEMLLGRFQSGDHVLADTEDGENVIFKISEKPEPEKELASST